MPAGLKRIYGYDHLHFITFSCYRRQPNLGPLKWRDVFLFVFEQVRIRYDFIVDGYVVMPEHVHLLIGEPVKGNPSDVMQALKQGVAQRWLATMKSSILSSHKNDSNPFWQKRFYDFNVFTEAKRTEKLIYMHNNPVKRGLVERPEDWKWSSYRNWVLNEPGPVKIDKELKMLKPGEKRGRKGDDE